MAGRDRGTWLLALGSFAGIAVAAVGLLRSGPAGGPPAGDDAVARVNGVAIRAEDYRRALDGAANGRRDAPDAAFLRHVLDRLVDEELLVQRGLELGLARVDPRVRHELAAAVIAAAVADEADAPAPSAEELAAFYARQQGFFAGASHVHVRRIWCAGEGAEAAARAATVAGRLRGGEAFAEVRGAFGDVEPVPLPDALLPPAKLADYLGATALRAALTLEIGGVSDPLRTAGGWEVLVLVAREDAGAPPLEAVADDVQAEWRRRAGERALRAYLDELRARADVQVVLP